MWLPDFSEAPAYTSKVIDSWSKENPEYEVKVWNEELVREIIPERRLRIFDRLEMPIKKADFARLEVICKYGGIYLDCDLIPKNNLNYFFSKKKIERFIYDDNKNRILEEVDCDISSKDLILSREWKDAFPDEREMFTALSRAANGIFITEKENPILIKFLETRHDKIDRKVLRYLGPHSLTTFLMFEFRRKKSDPSKVVIIPPAHFLWERKLGKQPEWSMSLHIGQNTWGDHSKDKYWDI